MKEWTEHSRNDGICCILCKKRKGFSTFLHLLFPTSNNPHIDGLCKCPVCGALLAVPTNYYSFVPKLIYLISSTLISMCLISFIVYTGIYGLLGRLFSTLLFTIGIVGCSIATNRIISATAMYYGTWRAIGVYEDVLSCCCKEEKRFKEDCEMKRLLTAVGTGLGVCFLAKNVILTIWILFVTTIGFVLRFCVFKSRR